MISLWKKLLILLGICLWFGSSVHTGAAEEALVCYEDGNVVGFIGDSITHVTYRSGGYVEMLEQYYLSRFPERKIEFRNLGADGYKLRDVLNIYDLDPGFRGIDKAVVMLGTNEAILKVAPEEYIGNMEELIERLKGDGLEGGDILLLSPPICDQNCAKNIDKNGNRRWAYEDRLLEYMGCLEEKAQEWGVHYLDFHTPMAELTAEMQKEDPGSTLTTDCIHPNAMGHRLIAYYILQAQGEGGLLSEINVPREGEVQALRSELTDYYRGDKGMRWILRPEVLPVAAAEEIEDFQAFFPEGKRLYGELLRIEGLEADTAYRILMGESEAGRFLGAELAEGIDLAVLQGHPQREIMEQIDALSKKHHQETARHRNMWVEVMMQRASYTEAQAAELYESWRAADDQLREQMHSLAESAAEDVFYMAVLEEGYSVEELEKEAEEARQEAERLQKEAEEQARKEEEERLQREAEEQVRKEEEERARREEEAEAEKEAEELQKAWMEQEQQEAEENAREHAAREAFLQRLALGTGAGILLLMFLLLGYRRKKSRRMK